jgi:hypothetical protein
MGDLPNKLIKKSIVDRYKIGIQTVSKDSIVDLPAGAIPLAIIMNTPVLAKNPKSESFDMGNISIVVYAHKIDNIEKDIKEEIKI